jgi:hypothetical protein
MKRTSIAVATIWLGSLTTAATIVNPSTAEAQVAAKTCEVEGTTTSNGLICTRNNKKLVWRPIQAAVPDPCNLYDNTAVAANATNEGEKAPELRIDRTFEEQRRRVCRLWRFESAATIFATVKTDKMFTDTAGRQVFFNPNSAVAVAALNGNTVYVYGENGRYVYWRESSPGIITGIKVWYRNGPTDPEASRAFLINEVGK